MHKTTVDVPMFTDITGIRLYLPKATLGQGPGNGHTIKDKYYYANSTLFEVLEFPGNRAGRRYAEKIIRLAKKK